MATFFVSYSRSVKDEVGRVVARLRSHGHEVWWDGDIPIMADWWATILTHIENSEIFIFVVSDKSIKSPYCIEELKYAVERNRPILPFIMDEGAKSEMPSELPSRNQWLMYDGDPEAMLHEITDAYRAIDWEKHKDIWAPRPIEPNSDGTSLAKQYQEARQLANELQFQEAKRRFRNIKSLDYGEWGNECDEWIARINSYATIMELVNHEYTVKRAYEAWEEHIQKYGNEFDPHRVNDAVETLKGTLGQESHQSNTQKRSVSHVSLLLSSIVGLGVIAVFLFAGFQGAESSSTPIFTIDQQRSEIRLSIGYSFYGTRTTMRARTNEISGTVSLDFDSPETALIGEISADASTLVTGSSELEDIFLRMIILQADPGESNRVIFQPTEFMNLPLQPINIGDTFDFQMIGNLTVQGVTNSTTVDVVVTVLSETEIQGVASSHIAFRDFRLEIPYIPEVEPDDEIILEIDFIAESDAQ